MKKTKTDKDFESFAWGYVKAVFLVFGGAVITLAATFFIIYVVMKFI